MHAHCVQALRLLLRLSMDTMRPCCGHHACAKPPSRWCRIKSADSCSNKLPSAACLAAWAIEDTDRRPNMPCSEGVCTHCGLVRTTRRTLCGGRIRCASTTALSISIAHVCGVQPRSISACSSALRALWCHTTHSGLPSGTLRRRLAGGSAWLHRIPHTKCSPKATASQSRTAYS